MSASCCAGHLCVENLPAGTVDGARVQVTSTRVSFAGGEAECAQVACELASRAALRHPHLLLTHECRIIYPSQSDSCEITVLATQERCAGGSLDSLTNWGPRQLLLELPFPNVLRMLQQVAAGVAHAHACGVAHGRLTWDAIHIAVRSVQIIAAQAQ